MPAEPTSFRLADLLTTASSLASYRGEPRITIDHLRMALAICLDEATIESLGPGLSPLVPRRGAPEPDADVLSFARRWNARLGDAFRALTADEVRDLRNELTP